MVDHTEIDEVLRILAQTQGTSTMLQRMGAKYDAFKVLISTILSARARDEATEVIAERLFVKYPTAEKLMRAKPEDVIKIIRRIGFYNAKSKNVIEASRMVVEQFGGKVPSTMPKLLELPGVGRKVANCVLVYAYKLPALPIDTHCHRIPNRLGWIKTKTPEETEVALEKIIPKKHWGIVNDTFVCHGKTTCLPISPLCSKCPIYNHCKRKGVTRHR